MYSDYTEYEFDVAHAVKCIFMIDNGNKLYAAFVSI